MSITPELKDLVFQSVKLLGTAIKDIYGVPLFREIEKLRQDMKAIRKEGPDLVHAELEKVYRRLHRKDSADLHRIVKAFSLMLETINACETAYRTHRLKDFQLSQKDLPDSLVYVFTSHPTEARSKEFLYLTDKVEDLLVFALEKDFGEIAEELLHLFQIALRIPLANGRRPQVKDEAQMIFHTVMEKNILSEQIDLKKKGLRVFFRTWVGGDKDGHPKVGPETLLQSLTMSRENLLRYIEDRVRTFQQELIHLAVIDSKMTLKIRILKKNLRALKKISPGDGKRVQAFKDSLQKLIDFSGEQKLSSPHLNEVMVLLKLYPALVMPMEIREDSSLVHEALKNKQPIGEMLRLIKNVSRGLDPRFYVRGFIISMCQTPQDLIAAVDLTIKHFGEYALPAVPLFENEQGLRNCVAIIEETFKKHSMAQDHKKRWKGRLEVMLGYSDSSKENGVLPSRLLVEKALMELEGILKKHALTPIFFHGSGGSTGRGGGSLKEQIAWWPHSALNVYKMTIQGETIQRHFNRSLILRSQVSKIAEEFSKHNDRRFDRPPIADHFADLIQNSYRTLVRDPAFQRMTTLATPYDFLSFLKIGSRPTKRNGKGQFSLRAIPWILCWTQTRLLLPIWWGTGSAYSRLTAPEKKKLKEYHQSSPLMQSYLKNLGFTLARIELGVWEFHLEHAQELTSEEKGFWKEKVREELKLSMEFFKALAGSTDHTWFQPRLGESIVFRSSMIHPLNVIQKISLERGDHTLLRETVTGIACGMLTTG